MLSTMVCLGSHHVPPVLALQPELGGMFADNMDMFSLTMWRLTCRTNYDQAVSSLKRSLSTMLQSFVLRPVALLDAVTRHHGVFGGEFALAFVLRDPSFLSPYLDIYSADRDFKPLCSSILNGSQFQGVVDGHEFVDIGALDALRMLECGVLVVHTCLGTTIRVHRSYTSSATAPISHAPSTALSNFVTEFGFGCSHPSLTLRRLALVADQELPHVPPTDHEVMDRLMDRGISFAYSPIAWSQFQGPLALGTTTSVCPPELPDVTTNDVGNAGNSSVPPPDGPASVRHSCPYCDPCGSCLSATSRASNASAVPHPAADSSPQLHTDEPSNSDLRGTPSSNDRAASASPSVTDGATAPSPTVEAGDEQSAESEHTLDLDIIVGPEYFPYVGVNEAATTHDISAWDLIPVSSIERPLYMGEIVYSGGERAVNPVPVVACMEPGPLQDVGVPEGGHAMHAACSVEDTMSTRRSSPPRATPSSNCSSSGVASADSCAIASPSSSSNGEDDLHGQESPIPSTGWYAMPDNDTVDPALGLVGADVTNDDTTTVVDHLILPSPDSQSSSALSPPATSNVQDGVALDAGDLPSSDGTEYGDSIDDADTVVDFPQPERCFRHIYLCPSQGRFFGDRGSFVDFFDPLQGGEDFCARSSIAPFGPVVIWRVLSTYNCERGCDIYDDALDIGIPPTPVILRPTSVGVDNTAD